MYFEWSEEKNAWLEKHRGVSFEAIQTAIQDGNLLDIQIHPNEKKYPNQRLLVVQLHEYVYLVPCVPKEEHVWFLKTIIPSCKATKHYLKSTNQ